MSRVSRSGSLATPQASCTLSAASVDEDEDTSARAEAAVRQLEEHHVPVEEQAGLLPGAVQQLILHAGSSSVLVDTPII